MIVVNCQSAFSLGGRAPAEVTTAILNSEHLLVTSLVHVDLTDRPGPCLCTRDVAGPAVVLQSITRTLPRMEVRPRLLLLASAALLRRSDRHLNDANHPTVTITMHRLFTAAYSL